MSQDGAQGVAKLSQDGILGSEFEVWRDLGRSWRSLGSYFERCWLEVGLSWLMLVLCCAFLGSKMAAKMAISAIKNAKMSQDGAQEAAKLSQDGILGSKLEAFTSILVSFLVPSS